MLAVQAFELRPLLKNDFDGPYLLPRKLRKINNSG
jgi:hypothetical protein